MGKKSAKNNVEVGDYYVIDLELYKKLGREYMFVSQDGKEYLLQNLICKVRVLDVGATLCKVFILLRNTSRVSYVHLSDLE